MCDARSSPSPGIASGVYSRWWMYSSQRGKTNCYVLVFILAILLPFVCSANDPHKLQSPHEGGNTFHYAQINVSFMDPEKKKETSSTIQGRFGINSDIKSVSGTVMHTISYTYTPVKNGKGESHMKANHYGCEKYDNKKIPVEPWIALVERGLCAFTKKVRKATKEHKASAIVVYNNDTGGLSDTTLMNHTDLSTISVFIGRLDGLMVAELLDKGIPVHMQIWPNGEGLYPQPPPNGISKTSVLFVSISFIVLLIISLAWLVFYYIQRFRFTHAKERLARRLACAAKKAIANIPQKTMKVGDKELESDFDQCAVCIEPYKAHDVIRILPCRHVFHKSCVDPWLLEQRSCPMCKLDILRAYGMQIGGSQDSVHHEQELGPLPDNVNHQEPEVSSSMDEECQSEEFKVLLVPQSCLHFHGGTTDEGAAKMTSIEVEEEEEEVGASTNLMGTEEDLKQSLPASYSSRPMVKVSRVEKSDEIEASSADETQALIAPQEQLNTGHGDRDEEKCPSQDADRCLKPEGNGDHLVETTEAGLYSVASGSDAGIIDRAVVKVELHGDDRSEQNVEFKG